ncbi:MAG: outer membrane protein assembly factor BamA [Candidatus Cloacimonadia bacterium]
MTKVLSVISVLTLLFFGSTLLYGEGELILDVKVVGNENIDAALIIATSNVEVGSYLSAEKISSAIKNLYKLSVFEDIVIQKKDVQGGVALEIKVKEFTIIDKITFQGNKRLRNTKLDEVITIKVGQYLSPFLLAENRNIIVDEYKKIGYNFASVEFFTQPISKGKEGITISIDEGDKVAVREVNFYGNKVITSRMLARKMKTKKAGLLRSGKFEQERFDEDLKKLVNYYNENGFIDARVTTWESRVPEKKFMYIDIYLQEGEQYRFGNINVSGNQRFTESAILEKFRFQSDDIFNLELFNKQVGDVASMYYEEGYIYASFDHDLQKQGKNIDINLMITENNRAKIRKIFISGNRKTKEKVIRRQLSISPGDYFRQSRVMRTQQNIYNLGFFEPNIKLDYMPINKDGDIDLLFELEDKHSGSANAGVGYNSQDKFIGQLSVTHNNLFGNSWQGGLSWEFGGRTQNFQFDFTNPNVFDSFTLGGFNIYHTRRDWSAFNYKIYTTGGSLRAGRSLFVLDHSRLVGTYSYYRKKYEVVNRDKASEYLKNLEDLGWRNTSSYSITFSRDSRDNIYFPSSGSHLVLFSELAGGPLGGDFDYFKQILQSTWYTKTYWKIVLRSKWRFGYVIPYGKSEEVPPDERFYLGGTGADGIRGFADRTIPTLSSDGGLRAIIHSTELALPIAGDQVVGLLFFDAGNSFNHLEDFNFWSFKKGIGLGIRINSPLGLIGFDYGLDVDSKKWEPHFQFGATF